MRKAISEKNSNELLVGAVSVAVLVIGVALAGVGVKGRVSICIVAPFDESDNGR